MPSDYVVRALVALADLAGLETTEEFRDGLYTEVWIDDGKKFFAALKEETQTPQELADMALDLILLTPEEAAEEPENDTAATVEQFTSFMGNLRAYADEWQANDLDPKDGSLRFYID
jgi:hypothetical protein